jgi:hypothetical protein
VVLLILVLWMCACGNFPGSLHPANQPDASQLLEPLAKFVNHPFGELLAAFARPKARAETHGWTPFTAGLPSAFRQC